MSSNGVTFVRSDGHSGLNTIPSSNPYRYPVFLTFVLSILYVIYFILIEFTPMSQWVREADVFEIISRLDVFRTYRYWKSFRKWRSYIRKRRLKANKTTLENSLVISYQYLLCFPSSPFPISQSHSYVAPLLLAIIIISSC